MQFSTSFEILNRHSAEWLRKIKTKDKKQDFWTPRGSKRTAIGSRTKLDTLSTSNSEHKWADSYAIAHGKADSIRGIKLETQPAGAWTWSATPS